MEFPNAFATYSQPMLDLTVHVNSLPARVPLRFCFMGSLGVEQLTAMLQDSIKPDEVWQKSPVMTTIRTFQHYPANYPANFGDALTSLGIDKEQLQLGIDEQHRSYIFLRGQEDILLTRPIQIDSGDCRPENIETIADLVALYGPNVKTGIGGASMNTAKGLTYLGNVCHFMGMGGGDHLASQFLVEAGKIGINMHLTEIPALTTAHCLVMVTPDKKRTMLFEFGMGQYYRAPVLNTDFLSEVNHIIGEGYGMGAGTENCMPTLLRWAHDNGKTTSLGLSSVDWVTRNKAEFDTVITGKLVDVLIGNSTEMRAYTGLEDPMEICNKLGEHCTVVVMTMREQGAVIKVADHPPVKCKAKVVLENEIIDSTGAGDFALAGVLHIFKQGYLPEQRKFKEGYSPKLCFKIGGILATGALKSQGANIDNWPDVQARVTQALDKQLKKSQVV